MNAHIINCDEEEFLNRFLPYGYLGVGIVIKNITPQGLSRACLTSYSMYADMKTIRSGDIVFVHAGQKIYGAFKATTEFCEAPNTPRLFLSNNIHYYPNKTKPKSGWKNNIKKTPNIGYYRRMAIMHFLDEQGRNLCFEKGIDSSEIFELKSKKKVWSIPERWKYTDAARTVRPLMKNEAFELLKILERENMDEDKKINVKPAKLNGYVPIQFILNPDVIIDEKIIEGWILGNIGRNHAVDHALGSFTSFGNNIPAGYLKFMDIFGYQELITGIKKYKIIEIKKEDSGFPDDINQLLCYVDWAVENIAEGDYKLVEGALIAKNFDDNCVSFVKNFNSVGQGRKIRLIKFNYTHPTYNNLNVTRIV